MGPHILALIEGIYIYINIHIYTYSQDDEEYESQNFIPTNSFMDRTNLQGGQYETDLQITTMHKLKYYGGN